MKAVEIKARLITTHRVLTTVVGQLHGLYETDGLSPGVKSVLRDLQAELVSVTEVIDGIADSFPTFVSIEQTQA